MSRALQQLRQELTKMARSQQGLWQLILLVWVLCTKLFHRTVNRRTALCAAAASGFLTESCSQSVEQTQNRTHINVRLRFSHISDAFRVAGMSISIYPTDQLKGNVPRGEERNTLSDSVSVLSLSSSLHLLLKAPFTSFWYQFISLLSNASLFFFFCLTTDLLNCTAQSKYKDLVGPGARIIFCCGHN